MSLQDVSDLRELAAEARAHGHRVAISPDAADRIADELARADRTDPDPHASAEWADLVEATHAFGFVVGRLDAARTAYARRFPVSRRGADNQPGGHDA